MKTIGIISNTDKDPELEYTKTLAENIQKLGGRVRVKDSLAYLCGGQPCASEEEVLEGSDIVVVLGGDGTFLKTARIAYKQEIPILGINLGNLGFLTEIDKNEIPSAAQNIMTGDYTVENRLMLEVDIYRDGVKTYTDTALNDIVVSRGQISRILHVKTFVNNVYIDTFPGDGLIISTPTGSTAYSLSAGGPIVEPDAHLMVVTPICPHILYSRSFVINSSSEVRAVLDEDFHHDASITVDGQQAYEIRGGDYIIVRKSSYFTKLARINSRDFFNILRTKIYYRGESLKDEIR